INRFDFDVIGRQITPFCPKNLQLTSSSSPAMGVHKNTFSAQDLTMLVPFNSQITNGLIENYGTSVYYNYSLKFLSNETDVVTTTPQPPQASTVSGTFSITAE